MPLPNPYIRETRHDFGTKRVMGFPRGYQIGGLTYHERRNKEHRPIGNSLNYIGSDHSCQYCCYECDKAADIDIEIRGSNVPYSIEKPPDNSGKYN